MNLFQMSVIDGDYLYSLPMLSSSSSEIKRPCIRIMSLSVTISISPFPKRSSAPGMSRIVWESVCDGSLNDTRNGILAFNAPVTLFADGL